LGIAAPELYIDAQAQGSCRALPTLPQPSLILSRDVAAVPLSRTARFVLTRALVLLRERLVGEKDPSASEVLLALLAATWPFPEAAAPKNAPERARVEAESKRLYKAIPRKARDAVRTAAKAFEPQLAGFDADAFVGALHAGAIRAATLLAGDAEVALRQTAAQTGERSGQVMDLLRFLLSDEYHAARRDLGWA
jgi:hypothetical protein